MAVFTEERTARRPHTCDDCGGPIVPGQRYVTGAITPKDPMLGDADGRRWGRIRSHLTPKDCRNE